jgi:hypothetical protein
MHEGRGAIRGPFVWQIPDRLSAGRAADAGKVDRRIAGLPYDCKAARPVR